MVKGYTFLSIIKVKAKNNRTSMRKKEAPFESLFSPKICCNSESDKLSSLDSEG